MDPATPTPLGATGERSVIEFGAFAFRLDTLELRHDRDPVALPPKACAVLGALLREAGGLVTREALYDAAWPRTVIEFDQALNTTIRQLRAALGDDARMPTYIETVPRRGYRFRHPIRVRPVRSAPGDTPQAPGRPWRRRTRHLVAGLTLGAVVVVAWAAGRTLHSDSTPAAAGNLTVPIVEFDGSQAEAVALARIADELEASVRTQWMRALPPNVTPALDARGPRDLLVTGSVVPAEDGARLHALILRVSDGSVVWAGSFNPFCPQISDPVSAIGSYVARELRRSVDAMS